MSFSGAGGGSATNPLIIPPGTEWASAALYRMVSFWPLGDDALSTCGLAMLV